MRVVFDIEATNLLNEDSIDYTASPYMLREDFKIHCIAAKDIDSNKIYTWVGDEVYDFPTFLEGVTTIIGHNIINYDLLVLKLYLGVDYTVFPDILASKKCKIVDTLVLSKTLNPDRMAHSIDWWGTKLGLDKIDWRSKAVELGLIEYNSPKGAEFKVYHPAMLEYNIRDVEVNQLVYEALIEEIGTWSWADAYNIEKAVAELITRQEHRGFAFNSSKAVELVNDLDEKLEALRQEVEPVLPSKPLAKTRMKDFTPPVKQFLKDGTPNQHIKNFIEKHGGEWLSEKRVIVLGLEHDLPLPAEALVKESPATMKDTTHIKEWLVGEHNWVPTAFKERDLTCDAKKKKLTQEKFEIAVDKYVEQTLNSAFCKYRLEHLECTRATLKAKLLKRGIEKSFKVLTNPTFTVGQEKEICPGLLAIESKFPYARKLADFLTYSHRRNSIIGGGYDPEDEEDAETGFLPNVRKDGRIPTPADTCGAGTSRFKHRLVANIPRTSSLYGKEMRSLFTVDQSCYQLGYDFDSLEAKIESHYVFKYPGGIEYGVSLTAEKPNDCHSVLAREISKIINKEFSRSSAKSVKYGCSYNAQAARVAKIVGCDLETAKVIFDTFWLTALPLKQLKDNMIKYWETTGEKKFLIGVDKRKLPIRSKGNCINTSFQNAGVICAKRAMVLHDRKLQQEGLIVDFFKEDWRAKPFCQQMCAYHDEAQSEISKSLVTFKMFDSEEEARTFKDSKVWSDIGKAKNGKYFRAYCKAGELAVESVKEAGEYYKLNVELTAGYVIGTDWASCH